MLDLYHATREDLIALADRDRRVAALEAKVVTLLAALAGLTARVGELLATGAADDPPPGAAAAGAPRGMPGLKPAAPPAAPRRPRQRRAHGFSRHRAEPTARRVHALDRCPDCAAPLAGRGLASIRASPVVHADETGWREDGRNGYVWTLSTPEHRHFVRGSRANAMLTATLGDGFGGGLVSDFYGVYTNYEGGHQYCWAHLLRDVGDLVAAHPGDAGVRGWADGVGTVFARARAVAGDALVDAPARRAATRVLRTDLAAICAPYLPAAGAPAPLTAPDTVAAAPPQRTLCQRITRHLGELFIFVEDPVVPATNNAAERALRHLVVSRKVSGGTRSAAGTTTKMTLASLFGTWRVQGLNPFDECRRLLASPQP